MTPAASLNTSPRPRGTRRRAVFKLAALFLAAVAGLLLYDAPLKPYDDLLPPGEEVPDPEENGYFFLKREREGLPKTDWNDRRIEKARGGESDRPGAAVG